MSLTEPAGFFFLITHTYGVGKPPPYVHKHVYFHVYVHVHEYAYKYEYTYADALKFTGLDTAMLMVKSTTSFTPLPGRPQEC